MAKISTYPSADTPLLLSDRLIGTEAIREIPSPIPLATKNFSLGELLTLFSSNFPAASLQEVLDMGNTAIQDIYLTGRVESTVIKPVNIEDPTGSQGTTFQYLSKGNSSINWVDLPIDGLQDVLNKQNTATQNITLTGNITSTYITPGNIKDESLNTGSIGQVLTKSATGLMWKNSSVPTAAPLADVLFTGNTATNDIILTGNFIKTGGTSSQFLKADGSVDSSTYALASSLPTLTSDLTNDGDDGINPFISLADIPAQVNSDWNATSGVAEILNKPTIPSLTGYVPYTGATTDVDLGTHDLTATQGTFATNGNPDTLTVNHTSGSGKALTITKGGAGEGIYVNKTSGSGNAVTIVGDLEATTLKKTGGTSSQFLKADGSVDSSTYITGLTVGTTPITSGTVGRVLFEGTGNVLQESANFFWDATNNRLGINTATPAYALDVATDIRALRLYTNIIRDSNANAYINNTVTNAATTDISIGNATAASITLTSKASGKFVFTTGNVLINTTTDAGFKLDVNGTARVSGNMTIATANNATLTFQSNNSNIVYTGGAFGIYFNTTRIARFGNEGTIRFAQNIIVAGSTNVAINSSAMLQADSTTKGFLPPRMTTAQRDAIASPAAGLVVYQNTDNYLSLYNGTNWQNVLSPNSNGNVLINKTTDAGYKLDVNGTARVSSSFRCDGQVTFTSAIIATAQVRIGSNPVAASSVLDVQSTTKGFLPPRMTTAQKNAIASPAAGLVVYDTDLGKLCVRGASAWETITSV